MLSRREELSEAIAARLVDAKFHTEQRKYAEADARKAAMALVHLELGALVLEALVPGLTTEDLDGIKGYVPEVTR